MGWAVPKTALAALANTSKVIKLVAIPMMTAYQSSASAVATNRSSLP